MATIIVNKGLALLNKSYWEGAADIEVALLTSSATPDKDWDFMDDVTNELTASGYARQNLGTRVATIDNTNDRVDYTAATVSFGAISGSQTIRYAVIFENTGGADSSNPILVIVQLGSDVTTKGWVYSQTWSNPILRHSM